MNDSFRAATTASPCGHRVRVTLGVAVLVAAFIPVSVTAQGQPAEDGPEGAGIDVPGLHFLLENSEDPWDKEDAIEALAESGQPHVAVPLIRIALTDGDKDVRLAAVEALATLGGDEAAEALEMALRDEESLVREEAIETLEAIGGDRAAQILIVALDDEDIYLRERVVDALAEIGSPIAIQFLEYAWAAADDESVRAAAAEWLRTLSRQVR